MIDTIGIEISKTTPDIYRLSDGNRARFGNDASGLKAKGLALVFGSPRLREAKCETIEQMRLVNTLCALPALPSGA